MDYGTYDSTMQYSAQANPEFAGAALAIFGILMLVFFVIFAAIYIYMAICLLKMARKTNTPNAWFAWIPFLNVWLMVQISQKEWWWFLLFFIPFVNIVASIIVWMAIAKALNKPDWLGILMIVPVANLIVPGYLAFSKSDSLNPAPTKPAEPAENSDVQA